jgi:hypothetical protein
MSLPGFSAEVSTTDRGGFFRTQSPVYANRSSAYTVTMAAQCCPPGYNTTGCTPPPPPSHCCSAGFHCCGDCLPGRCVPDPVSGQGCVPLRVLCQ